ncbi:hypothetical protein HPP92_002355 [Vanilla planifolia]|uniref:DUF7358 domain-containing protein n=1 Tax=Vanilla planifolia TaxID=51239 RepID=A0A835VMF3_VANPL|nr:hypothetical protein HPP92_002355 [Vanilla planifolia]
MPFTAPLLKEDEQQIKAWVHPAFSSGSCISRFRVHLFVAAMAELRCPRSLRWAALVAGALNVAVVVLGAALFPVCLRRCGAREKSSIATATAIAALRLGSMLCTGIAQGAAAVSIATANAGSLLMEHASDGFRHRRRRRYLRWLLWARLGMFINALQFIVAIYLMYIILKDFAKEGGHSTVCFLGHQNKDRRWKKILVVSFLVIAWLVVIIQCLMGSDVLRWRSFYATQDSAWKAHYSEVFDHGIREVLCCLGRVKYLSVLEEDEVFFVARLLGDLVAYRVTGTRHLELLAGLALLQNRNQPSKSYNDIMKPPVTLMQEAAFLHQFAEAAYTGPLLDVGRNLVLFPCSWLYRQGSLTPWKRKRRPLLQGDNWWRGHAAAFLKCANLPAEALRRGRVIQPLHGI